MTGPASLPAPGAMTRDQFLDAFGAVYEHSPWIVAQAWARGITALHDGADALAAHMAEIVREAGRERQLELLRAHPDLAGKLALAGDMTGDSLSEQSSAGLDQCTPDQLARFHELNAAYKARFGFPFILAVRGRDREQILEIFEQRAGNEPETEFAEALAQVNTIARLRIRQIMKEPQ